MNSQASLKSAVPDTSCYHCGDHCDAHAIKEDGHSFCCDGCRLVYELLRDNNLCNYYDLTKAPGKSAGSPERRKAYLSLDDPAVRPKLIRFENGNMSRVVFQVPVMHCSSCIWLLEHLPRMKKGIIASTVNFQRKEVSVDFENGTLRLSEIASLLADIGYAPAISLGDMELRGKGKKNYGRVLRIGIAGFCFGNIMLLSFPEYLSTGDLAELPQLKTFFGWISLLLSLPVLLYSASGFFVSAWKTIRTRTLNIDAPIALAIAVTFGRSVYEIVSGTGAGYLDSMSGIVFFMLIGRYFQDRTYDNLSFDRDYKSYFPVAVAVESEGKEESRPVTRLAPGDRIVIRGGELIPADARLLSEEAAIDYSFVSGEAVPVALKKGDLVYAGARQTSGSIRLEVVKETSQSYLTQLWNNDAFSKRREEERKTYIDFINRWFSLGVLLTSFGSAAAWYFINPALSLNVMTAVLIVACPCTLLLAATFTNGNVLRWLGNSAFYLKNADAIDRIATADTIVFDKTGTITGASASQVRFEGEPLSAWEKDGLAALVSQSGHVLSRRIAEWTGFRSSGLETKDYRETTGKGISASIDGTEFLLGSRNFTGRSGKTADATEAWLVIGGDVRGRFVFSNGYRPQLEEVIGALKKKFSVWLLSGDHDAERMRLQPLFGDRMHFSQTPEEKLTRIRDLQEQGRKVVMIGDGLNDAGALMQADAGIAVSEGMNNFFPACDAILDGGQFAQLPRLLAFTRVARRVVIASFVVSVMYNLAGIWFSVRGELSPMIAAVLMPASSFSVILLTTLLVRYGARKLRRAEIRQN